MNRILLLLLFVGIGSVSVPCRGVIVFQKNKDEPIRGFLIHEDGVSIEVHEHLPSGEIRKHVLPRIVIDDIVRAVDSERLAALTPGAPDDYRSYAEDLAVKTEDPEARVMAIRLYLIAAYLDPDELGRSCLLGMAGLARTPDEERAFHAMAFSLDADHDPALLKAPKVTASAYTGLKAIDRQALRTAVRLLRSGKMAEAERYFSRPAVRAAATYYSHVISEAEYQEAVRVEGRLSDRLLRKFLTLELTLSDTEATETTDKSPAVAPWSQLIARDDTAPITPRSLLAITEFDPRKSVYQEGKWREATE